jgi:hypothetical protein
MAMFDQYLKTATRHNPTGFFKVAFSLYPEKDAKQDTYVFTINPSKLGISRKKVERWTLTKFGFERQFWMNDLCVYQYQGSTGTFRPDEKQIIDNYTFDITKTKAWQDFTNFENFYLSRCDERSVQMKDLGRDFTLVGSLDDFSYDKDANDPFRIQYKFKFTGIPLSQEDSVKIKIEVVQGNNSTDTGQGLLDPYGKKI